MAHSISVFPFLFSIIISSFLVPTALSVRDFDLTHGYNLTACTVNYTKKGTDAFRSNLKDLLQKLGKETASSNGFLTASSGKGPDKVYGLALCRGDVPRKDCKACLNSAIGNITKNCPHSKAAIAWRDFCLLKYSNTSFAGKIDIHNRVRLINVKKATDPKLNQTAVSLLNKLSEIATGPGRRGQYAEGKVILVEGDNKLQGMVQCTRDLSVGDCATCLKTAVTNLSLCCADKKGARILYGSCQIRYEIYTFLK